MELQRLLNTYPETGIRLAVDGIVGYRTQWAYEVVARLPWEGVEEAFQVLAQKRNS
jgi:hypothetical protein